MQIESNNNLNSSHNFLVVPELDELDNETNPFIISEKFQKEILEKENEYYFQEMVFQDKSNHTYLSIEIIEINQEINDKDFHCQTNVKIWIFYFIFIFIFIG